MNLSRRRFAATLPLGLLFAHSPSVSKAPESEGVAALLRQIAMPPSEPPSDGLDPLAMSAIEAGDAAVPRLLERLQASPDDEQQGNILFALSHVGGPRAADALWDFYQQTGLAKAEVCYVFASDPSPQRIRFLIESLRGAHYGDDAFSIVQSAWSLGLLRESSALADLQRCADEREGMASSAAADAIRWIRRSNLDIEFARHSDADDLLTAILLAGIPEDDKLDYLSESSQQRVWSRRSGGVLIFTHEKDDATKPTIAVSSYRSRNQRRALVTLDIHSAPLDGHGYEYVLNRNKEGWRVRGISLRWVA